MKLQVIPVTHYQQNCSLLGCKITGLGALIDPGGESERLIAAAKTANIQVDKILLTHGHLDHVGAALDLSQRLGIPIIGPQQEDAFWLQALPQQAQMFGFAPLEPFEPQQWLHDGDSIRVGELELEVIHCPGHTPGHVVFFLRQHMTAFVGDVLFNGSIGRSDFPRGDHTTLINSIRHRLLPLGDDVQFVCGHGPDSTFGNERLHNPFLK